MPVMDIVEKATAASVGAHFDETGVRLRWLHAAATDAAREAGNLALTPKIIFSLEYATAVCPLMKGKHGYPRRPQKECSPRRNAIRTISSDLAWRKNACA